MAGRHRRPQNLPVGVVGDDAQVTQVEATVSEKADGAVVLTRYDSRDDAVTAIEQRESYGAIVLGPSSTPEVLTASAANPTVAQMLDELGQGMQAAIDEQIRAAVESQIAAAQQEAAARVQSLVEAVRSGQVPQIPESGPSAPVQIPAVTVTVTDIVPFAASDPRGAGLGVALFPLVLGGLAVGIVSTLVVRGSAVRRVTTVVVASVGAGLVLAGILQAAFGALQGSFWLNAAACAATIAAIAATVTGFAGLLGPAGVGVGAVFTMLIANPLSAAAVPVEFLLQPWGAIGQWLPPGAAATLLRSLSYFPDAATAQQWIVLLVWAAGGLALTLVDLPARRLRAGQSVAEHPLTV
ncbi:hypothetical protein IT882_13980 [Microbacterium schleiferi]|uniref:ABC transporter permease n=1 Tax=Microbacterium schleiferi TaxID=69362 RepID=A0A7S8MWK1_9MICO|nr:hypothetical protein [Microbacterium schleiferi]QPE04268.1 hypothetical protein IT882_13980 [Microbacterium schleiferi]